MSTTDLIFVLVIVLCFAIGGFTTWYCHSRIKKYQNVENSTGMTGAQAARNMMEYSGVENVTVVRGNKNDNYFDPHNKLIALEPSMLTGTSVTALATACHEVAHAYQFKHAYVPMRIRGFLVPVVDAVSNVWVFILLIGFILQITGLVDLAIILYAFVVFFQIITLPVEFDASRRATAYLEDYGLAKAELKQCSSVLRACALTYIAAALIAVIQIVYLLVRNHG